MRIGIDTGGTFTDFVFLGDGVGQVHKVPSTPEDPLRAILAGLKELRPEGLSGVELVHGTTVGTNAFLTRRGAKVVLLATQGFEDVVFIGRQTRAELFSLSPTKPTEQVRSGALQFHISGSSFQQYVPEAQIIGLPGLWKNHDHVFRVMTSDVGKQIIEMAERKNIGIKILNFVTTGERYFYGRKRAFENTADFAGIKIRVDTMPASAAIWRTLRANPVPMPLTEVYSALQTGVIDAAEYPPCVALSVKTYEQAKYITTTAHQLTHLALQVNQKWYDGLPADLRGQIKGAVDEWLPSRYQMAKEAEGGCIAKMKEQGAEVHALKDPDKLRATLEPIQKEFGDKYNLNDLIAKIKAMN